MKNIIFGLLFFNSILFSAKANSLKGIIYNQQNNETLIGVSIYFPDLKIGTQSKNDGSFFIENLPSKKVLVQISSIGFQSIIETIDLSNTTKKDFYLTTSVKEVHDVVITGLSKATERNRTPTSILLISKNILLQNASTNIIDAISSQAGISQITTGVGISKPIIRGLGANRVVVVNDGIRQEGQQWGDEHGIEIDENTVDIVEILKGPASLSFGSDAMAGVVNFIRAKTLPLGKMRGSMTNNFQTNNGMYSISGNFTGNEKGFIWDIVLSGKNAHSYKNKADNYVFNSGMKEQNLTATFGLNKKWGYSHLTFSNYGLKLGIIEGIRDSLTGKFTQEIIENDTTTFQQIVSENEIKKYNISVPYQKINHKKIVWNNNVYLKNSNLKFIVGYQENKRQEYDNVFQPNDFGMGLFLKTLNYDVRYMFAEKNNLTVSTGVNGMYQQSKNQGEEYLIPNYNLFDIGGFLIAKKSINKFDISGGLRLDTRKLNTTALILDENDQPTIIDSTSYTHKFNAIHKQFLGASGSVGFSYQISKKTYTKLNISKGFRSPNIGELSANGVHDGTIRYEIGNTNLKPEQSWEIDYSFGINSEHITLELDLFNNYIKNYIFQHLLNSKLGGDSISEGYRTYQFNQGNANLLGGELMFEIHPHPFDWLHFQNSFSYVQAKQINQSDSTQFLPMIPAPKWRTELKFEKGNLSFMKNAYFKIDMEHYFAQNNIYNAFGTETATPNYTLFNIGLGSSIQHNKQTVCSIFLSLNNATNKIYQSHLSRIKYADLNYATGNRGVFNMGRNLSIKLIVPFEFKK